MVVFIWIVAAVIAGLCSGFLCALPISYQDGYDKGFRDALKEASELAHEDIQKCKERI